MISTDFFDKARLHLHDNLPFVLYRKPLLEPQAKQVVKSLFQKTNSLYSSTNFTESGFVMAPFDLDWRTPIVFPTDKSEQLQTVFSTETICIDSKQTVKSVHDTQAHQHHLDLVQKGINAITSGVLQKVVLSRSESQVLTADIITTYQRLLKQYPTAFVYCWFHPQIGLWLGATPETLVKINGNTLKTMALAGTKSALEFPDQPEWSPKELREQQFVTDYIANNIKDFVSHLNISPVQNSRAGKLWHLKSAISGRLNTKEDLKPLLLRLHPTPAVAGTPKEKAIDFIKTNEGYNREFYSGFLGELNVKTKQIRRSNNRRSIEQQSYLRATASTDLFVNLRCMKIAENKAKLFVGGGIVADSQPESEWRETVNKSHTMRDIL